MVRDVQLYCAIYHIHDTAAVVLGSRHQEAENKRAACVADGVSDICEFGVVPSAEIAWSEQRGGRRSAGGGAVSGGRIGGGDQLHVGCEPRDGDSIRHNRKPDGGIGGTDILFVYREPTGNAFL